MLVKGNLQQLVLSSDIVRLLGLEGCLSGKCPPNELSAEGGARGPCGQLARAGTVKVVLGPGTFINEAANQIDDAARRADAAGAEAQARQAAEGRRSRRARSRLLAERREPPRPTGEQDHDRALPGGARERGAAVRPHSAGRAITDPNFVSALVFDSDEARGDSQAALRLPVPLAQRRAHLGAHDARASAKRSASTRSR